MQKLALVVVVLASSACWHDVVPHEPGADEDGAAVVFDGLPEDLYDQDGLAPPNESPIPFVRLGARFSSNDPSALEVRTSADGATWSAWAAPTLVFVEDNAFAGHVDVAEGTARFFQHRVLVGREPPSFLSLEPIAEIAMPVVTDEEPTVDVQASEQAQGLNIDLVTRSEWGARAAACRSFTGVKRATIHHTVTANDDVTPMAVQMRQIQTFHMLSRGWCDVGYNFLVTRDGRIFEGRGYGVLGAHAENANADNMGISFIGTYTSATPPLAQQIAAAKILRYLHDRAGIPLSRTGDNGVKGHRQRGTTATSCPGDKLYSLLGSIVERAREKDFDQGPCASGNFDGAFCDDENHGNEAFHDKLKRRLGVDFHCADKNGSPAFCATTDATRKDAIYVLGAAAKMPTSGHPDAFPDDDGKREGWFNAAHAYGIVGGIDGRAEPDRKVSRSSVAVFLKRMYALPVPDGDYFDDDDGSAYEAAHNAVAAAGLMVGSSDGGGRRDFEPSTKATRSTLAVVAWRAFEKGLVPVWKIPEACLSNGYAGAFCDDDGTRMEGGADAMAAANVQLAYGTLAGRPTFQGDKEATRAAVIYALTQTFGIPLAGHPDAFDDDDSHPRERWFDAAKAFGVVTGYAGGTQVRATDIATRDTIALVAARMFDLPATNVDYFTDDDGTNMEPWHNKVAAAGLFTGSNDGAGGKAFKGDGVATRATIALVIKRAIDAGLVPVWQ